MDNDTICAVSTAFGMAGIGIVRLSGPDALAVVARLFRRADGLDAMSIESHRITYGHVIDPADGSVVDEALVAYMKAPRSYTREDVVEVNCHGGPAAVRRVYGLLVACGARPSEPGEFTKRAYINGRIDLTQAEAVMDVIASRTELSLRASVNQLKGGLRDRVEQIREKIAGLLALTEVSIDFPEEDIEYVPIDGLLEAGNAARAALGALIATYDEGRILRDGLSVAIVGRPNVGKSSILNMLASSERAIVTDVPGTTRDTVEEVINVGGVPVRVIDTAGIRESHDVVEREGIRRSVAALDIADLALVVVDGSVLISPEDTEVIEKARDKRFIPVINKSDLPAVMDETGMRQAFGEAQPVFLSAKTMSGMDTLVARIREEAMCGVGERPPDVVINMRHRVALEKALSALTRFIDGCGNGVSPEFLALELREALDAVGEVVGVTTPDDILDRIFRDFCIGK